MKGWNKSAWQLQEEKPTPSWEGQERLGGSGGIWTDHEHKLERREDEGNDQKSEPS